MSYSIRSTKAKEVQPRRNPPCPVRPVWAMHSTSTTAPSAEGVARHSHARHSAANVASVFGRCVIRCWTYRRTDRITFPPTFDEGDSGSRHQRPSLPTGRPCLALPRAVRPGRRRHHSLPPVPGAEAETTGAPFLPSSSSVSHSYRRPPREFPAVSFMVAEIPYPSAFYSRYGLKIMSDRPPTTLRAQPWPLLRTVHNPHTRRTLRDSCEHLDRHAIRAIPPKFRWLPAMCHRW